MAATVNKNGVHDPCRYFPAKTARAILGVEVATANNRPAPPALLSDVCQYSNALLPNAGPERSVFVQLDHAKRGATSPTDPGFRKVPGARWEPTTLKTGGRRTRAWWVSTPNGPGIKAPSRSHFVMAWTPGFTVGASSIGMKHPRAVAEKAAAAVIRNLPDQS